MTNSLISLIDIINDRIWIFLIAIIIFVSLFFSIKLKFIQFNFVNMFKSLFKKEKNTEGISSFKTLMLSLAGRIGVGSISGVALAIYIGGPGTIFWIWVICILTSILAYSETFLGIKYKVKDGNKYFKGGPAFYIKNGLNNKILGAIYSILIILTYVVCFICIQSNTITKAITTQVGINPLYIGVILGLISFFIIFGGIKKIANVTSKIVPIMAIMYVLIAVYIVLINIKFVPAILLSIISGAFNCKSFISGFIPIMLTGVQRGIFSSEAGIGTGSIAASSSGSNDAKKEANIQMLGIYITSFLICTATAIIILCSNYSLLNIDDPNGIEIATYAFKYHLGSFGNILLIISIILFAFSTILSGYYYGETSIKYFNDKPNKSLIILKILTVCVILYGSIVSSTLIWSLADLFVSFIAIINIYAIIKLHNKIK